MVIFTKKVPLPDIETTRVFGELIGALCEPGDVIALRGDLGAGKTTLVQAIAAGAEVDPAEYVSSPSFALLHEYQGRIPIYHMDFYRISGDDVEDLGLDEYLFRSGLSLVEWYDRVETILPAKSLLIILEITSETSRIATVSSTGSSWQHRVELLARQLAAKSNE